MKRALFLLFLFLFSAHSAWAMAKRPPKESKKPAGAKPAALSLSLWDSYGMALKRSDELAIKKEEVGRTLGSFLEAAGEAIGDFDYEITDKLQDPQKGASSGSSFNGNLTKTETRERKFVYSQPLFQGFRAMGALSGAGSLKKQREDEWERAKQLLFLDVVNAFYEYLRLKKEIEIIDGILDLYEDRLKNLKQWENIGRSRPSEVATARTTYENSKADLAKSKGELANAKNFFAFLIGVTVGPEELKEETLPAFSDQSVHLLEWVQQRPDVEASRHAVKTARGEWIVAQSDLWPKITLDSNLYEHREGVQSGISWDNLVTFKIPLGTGGTTLGQVRDALAVWREAKLTYSLTRRRAQREISDALDNWKSSAERYHALEKAMQAAQENFTMQSDDYRRHLVSNLDVLTGVQNLFNAKRDANQAFYDMAKVYWQLEVAKGNCCSKVQV